MKTVWKHHQKLAGKVSSIKSLVLWKFSFQIQNTTPIIALNENWKKIQRLSLWFFVKPRLFLIWLLWNSLDGNFKGCWSKYFCGT